MATGASKAGPEAGVKPSLMNALQPAWTVANISGGLPCAGQV